MEIQFDFNTQGDVLPDAFLSPYELDLMFAQTASSIRAELERKLGEMMCAEHGQAPRFNITGMYDNDSEQMDIQYHIDTCCKGFLLKVMQTLNMTN